MTCDFFVNFWLQFTQKTFNFFPTKCSSFQGASAAKAFFCETVNKILIAYQASFLPLPTFLGRQKDAPQNI